MKSTFPLLKGNTMSTTNLTADDDLERLARKRAKTKMGWFIHATVYSVVNAMLLTASLLMGRHWALFPLLGWGLGLALHGAAVWLLAPGSQLYEQLLDRERATLRQRDAW